MIELYEGRLGGGKTYSATVRIVDHLCRGGLVATNIDIVWPEVADYIARRFGLVVKNDQLLRLHEDQIGLFHRSTPSGTAELPVLVVIDEAHLTFNARDFAQTDRLYRETLTFLTQSRKVHTDVIFIAQSVLNMDKQFMRLVQYIWRFRDLSKWKIPGLGIPYPLNQILAVQFDYDGRTILQRSFVRKDKNIFKLFRTNALLREFPRLENIKTKHSLERTKKQYPMAKFLIPIGLVVGVIAAFTLYKSFKGAPEKANNAFGAPARAAAVSTSDTAREEKRKHELYDIYAEHFQAWNESERALKTAESGWYQVGEMSSRGFVIATSNRRAKVAQPDGRTGWVVATLDHVPSAVPMVTPVAAEKNGEIITVKDTGLFPPKDSIFVHETVAPADRSAAARPTETPSPSPFNFPAYRNRIPIAPRPLVSPNP